MPYTYNENDPLKFSHIKKLQDDSTLSKYSLYINKKVVITPSFTKLLHSTLIMMLSYYPNITRYVVQPNPDASTLLNIIKNAT